MPPADPGPEAAERVAAAGARGRGVLGLPRDSGPRRPCLAGLRARRRQRGVLVAARRLPHRDRDGARAAPRLAVPASRRARLAPRGRRARRRGELRGADAREGDLLLCGGRARPAGDLDGPPARRARAGAPPRGRARPRLRHRGRLDGAQRRARRTVPHRGGPRRARDPRRVRHHELARVERGLALLRPPVPARALGAGARLRARGLGAPRAQEPGRLLPARQARRRRRRGAARLPGAAEARGARGRRARGHPREPPDARRRDRSARGAGLLPLRALLRVLAGPEGCSS